MGNNFPPDIPPPSSGGRLCQYTLQIVPLGPPMISFTQEPHRGGDSGPCSVMMLLLLAVRANRALQFIYPSRTSASSSAKSWPTCAASSSWHGVFAPLSNSWSFRSP